MLCFVREVALCQACELTNATLFGTEQQRLDVDIIIQAFTRIGRGSMRQVEQSNVFGFLAQIYSFTIQPQKIL